MILAQWLYEQMPSYAKECIGYRDDLPSIDWDGLIAPSRLGLYSNGERCALALAAEIDDRMGVERAVLPEMRPSIIGMLSHLDRLAAQEYLKLLADRVELLVG